MVELVGVWVVQAAIAGAVGASSGAVEGAIIAGVFLLVNSVLTWWLTNRRDRLERAALEAQLELERREHAAELARRRRRH